MEDLAPEDFSVSTCHCRPQELVPAWVSGIVSIHWRWKPLTISEICCSGSLREPELQTGLAGKGLLKAVSGSILPNANFSSATKSSNSVHVHPFWKTVLSCFASLNVVTSELTKYLVFVHFSVCSLLSRRKAEQEPRTHWDSHGGRELTPGSCIGTYTRTLWNI